MRSGKLVLLLSILAISRVAIAACPVERATVKSATDAQASSINPTAFPTSIVAMQAVPMPRPLPQDARVAPDETTLFSVTATLIGYALTPEGEIQLVLSDDLRRTIIAKIPSVNCIGGSRFSSEISTARSEAEWTLSPTTEFKDARMAVQVQGLGFFDFLQGQRGQSPNGLSIYPVTSIDFTPPFQPQMPPPPSKRRAAGIGAKSCTKPTLSITSSRTSACSGETVTVSWAASDPTARVAIDNIGTALPASGSRAITATASAAYSGRATTSCGAGIESVAIVNLTQAPFAGLTGPVAMATGDTTTLSITVASGTAWTLTSSLGNSISPSSGNSSRTVSYTATRSGSDTVTLTTASNACGSGVRTHAISISAPPPTNNGLLCCDGTRSPSCFSCSKKSGCCSGHGGVCGCG